jgi:hypothetical protein
MITEWLVYVGTQFWGFIAGLFPDWTLPAELSSPDGFMAQINAFGSGLGVWVDWGFVATVGAIPLGIWATVLMIRAVRLLISHLPFIGGNG